MAAYSVNIKSSRYVGVDGKNDVTIRDDVKGQRAFFMAPQWARFVGEMHDIDVAIQHAMTLKPTNFKRHTGRNWHVSVMHEVPIVDVQHWYVRKTDNSLQPTPVGVADVFAVEQPEAGSHPDRKGRAATRSNIITMLA